MDGVLNNACPLAYDVSKWLIVSERFYYVCCYIFRVHIVLREECFEFPFSDLKCVQLYNVFLFAES